MIAAPAMAQSVGSVGATYAHSEIDTGIGSADGDSYIVDGQVAFAAGSEWTVTVDGAAQHDAESDYTTGAATVHGTRMFGSDVRGGGFAGAVHVDGETLWAVGAEVQKYVGDWTVGGQLSYGQIDDTDADLWGARTQASYFVNPNLRLDAGLGYTKIDVTGGDTDAWSYGIGAEYQLAASPISLTAGYERFSFDDFDADIDTFTVGVRYSFGGDLKTRDRAGANLGSVASAFGSLLGL